MKHSQIFHFSDLADSAEFEKFYITLWKLLHIPLGLRDPEDEKNNKLFCAKEEFNPICKIIHSSSKGLKRCMDFNDVKIKEAVKVHRGIYYKCYAGLTDFTLPICVGRKHIATISCGQILPEAPTDKGFDKLWDCLRDLNISKKTLRKVYFESPHMSPDKIESVLNLLTFAADYFCEVGVRLRLSERDDKYPEIKEATEYLKKHFSEPLIASEVAEYVGFSRPYFSKLFKKVQGVSFTQYLQELRLEEVKKFLRDTDVTISKIAFNCGFGGLSYFNTYFRRMMKCSPTQYRAKSTTLQQ